MKHLFFDLDGTVVDSSAGIKAGFRAAFERMDTAIPSDTILETFIGPPLEVSFSTFGDANWIQEAIHAFRIYYKKHGVYQVEVYKGLTNLLSSLKKLGYHLYITTSKNEPMAHKMLDYLNIDSYFTAIYGALPTAYHKTDVIKRAITEHQLPLEECAIIGDTKFDMIGGKNVGIQTLGVLWGFGTREDLQNCQADEIFEAPEDLLTFLTNLNINQNN
ncbi:HAD-IA family hydrolase [Streptococcus himalayensis]|uniref:Phosphoglycolate phosphatase n=1 Tax=Streptococcus himalayensis TaxID=1888195 RepID=A0A917EEF3_9STRE|nr:HAD-IA family hydrolase [Streptococcus himalayensis]GGE23852.1 phosphoglycolate phosphatase [Streptococcus himalayensis]